MMGSPAFARRNLLAGLALAPFGIGCDPSAAVATPSSGTNAPLPGHIFFGLDISNDNVDSLILAIDYLRSFDVSHLLVIVQSSGGNVSSAAKFFNYAQNSNAGFDTVNLSSIESAANLIYLSGRKRYASDNSYFMLHPASNGGVGPNTTVRTYQEQQASLGQAETLIRTVLRGRTRLSHAEIERSLREQIFIGAAQARTLNIVTEASVPMLDYNALKVVVTGGDSRYRAMFQATGR